jgi:phosphinothricin acetyltransferase
MDPTTRRATAADAAAIADIYNQAVLRSTATFDTQLQSAEERAAWLASHGERHPVLVRRGPRQLHRAFENAGDDRKVLHRRRGTSIHCDGQDRGIRLGSMDRDSISCQSRHAGQQYRKRHGYIAPERVHIVILPWLCRLVNTPLH